MRVIIVANSVEKDFKNIYNKEEKDYIITTDLGIKEVLDLGQTPNLSIGDFDSGGIEYQALSIKQFPKKKNETDLELALMEVKSLNNVEEVYIYNSTNGRLDHFLTNIKLIKKYSLLYNIPIYIVNKDNTIRYLSVGSYKIKKANYEYLSIINFDNVELDISGTLYTLDRTTLNNNDTYTVSNEIVNDEAIINIYKGGAYLVLSK